MSDLSLTLEQSLNLIQNLPPEEKTELRLQIQRLSEKYNIPGVSSDYGQIILEGPNDSSVVLNSVGGNITDLNLGGETIYLNGSSPFVVPLLNEKGEIVFYSPFFYRNIGHHVIPAANTFDGFNPEVHAEIERITGIKVRKDYNTGHHGVSQCRIGDIKNVDGSLVYTVHHPADKTNLFEFDEQMTLRILEDGTVEEKIEIYNPNNYEIPLSLLRHPYFYVPSSSREKAAIHLVDSNENTSLLYELKDYLTRGETRLPLPLKSNGESIIFDRGDGVVLEIEFEGNYGAAAGLQLFSNGPTNEKLMMDYEQKFAMHKERLKVSRDLMNALDMDTSWYSEENIQAQYDMGLILLKDTCTICIEDATAKDNIYDKIEGIRSANILNPGEIQTFIRRTRRLQ